LVPPVAITFSAYLHIISAISWLGASFFFLMILAPGFRSLTPMTSLEFNAKVGGKATRYFILVASSTILFGFILLYLILDGDFTALWTTAHGETLAVGLSIGLIAYLDAALLTGPTLRKASKLAAELMKNPPQGPPTQLIGLMKKGGQGAAIGTILLFIAVAFMVAAGFPF
jgi:uncharacterized membrane protein